MAIRYFLSLLLLISCIHAEEKIFWNLNGYLDSEKIAHWQEQAKELEKNPPSLLAISINSNGADIQAFLDLVKSLYTIKINHSTRFIVYINGNALGPSAIIPFLADELYASLIVSWGDIPLGTYNAVPTNILRNQVTGFISASSPRKALLEHLASAMIDPQSAKEEEWKQIPQLQTLSLPNQILVINQNQMRELGLVKQNLSLEAFINFFDLKKGEELSTDSLKQVEQSLKDFIHYDSAAINKIGKIKIDDRSNGISQATWVYVRNALDYYQKNPPIFIILELNTPGGEVFAAQKISDALKNFDTQYNIPVVTFINNWAISAGAMLAYSTRFIAITQDASMGAAEPIIQDSSGATQTASEKVNSALRTDFANRAKFFGRNPFIAEAMVDKDIILALRHGKIIKLDSESQVRTSGPDPDKIISPKGKLLTLNAEELINYKVADLLLLPRQLVVLTDFEREMGRWSFDKELLSKNAFFTSIPNAEVDEYIMDWKTRFFSFLASPVVQSALFLGLLLGFYLEMNTPGFGLPGGIAISCLALIILSSFSQELASWFEVILLLLGLGMILVEIFLLPSFGVVGFIGIALFIFGLFSLMLPGIGSIDFEWNTQTFNAAGEAFLTRLAWLSATFVIALIIIYVLAKYFVPSFAGLQRLVLKGHEQEASQGYVAGLTPEHLPHVGEKGIALSYLRPSGKILVKQNVYDALSVGRYIERDAKIVIVRIEGSVIFVQEEPR